MTVLDDYLARTPRSRELFERATGSLPGGSTRTTVYTAPYPPYVACRIGPRPGRHGDTWTATSTATSCATTPR